MASNIVLDGLNIHKSARNCSRQKPIFHVIIIYQTRETVFHQDIQTPRRELKILLAVEYF